MSSNITIKDFNKIKVDSIRPMFVAKIESSALPLNIRGFFPTIDDCFVITEEAVRNMEVLFQGEPVQPSLGSKFIGESRDKGSITGIVKDNRVVCIYTLNNIEERDRLAELLTDLSKKHTIINDTTIEFNIDIIADVSTGRDNVVPLLVNSAMNLTAVLEDRDIEMSIEEIQNLDIMSVISSRKFDHRVEVRDKEGKVLHNFGEVAILLEDFFWQPSHDNKLSAGEKAISFSYPQARDAIAIISPTLYDCMLDSIDYKSIHEDMLCLGLDISEFNIPSKVSAKVQTAIKKQDRNNSNKGWISIDEEI